MKKLLFILIVILILISGGVYYWYFMREPLPTDLMEPTPDSTFNPFNQGSVTPKPSTSTAASSNTSISTKPSIQVEKISLLRHLSSTPIGGYMASSTASSTIVRYFDRGVGHIYQADSLSSTLTKITNTTIPRVYESYWDKNLRNTVVRYIRDDGESIVNFYGDVRPVKQTASSTAQGALGYEVKGKFLASTIQDVAVSPKGDRIFTFNIENERGVGYISNFDEGKKTKMLDTPLTQMNVAWPEENTIALTTKGSGVSSGFLYFLDAKTSTFKRILGNIIGLSTKVSTDAKKVLYSTATGRRAVTSVYNTKDNSTQEIIFRTLADKCVWSKKYVNEAYCAVPNEMPAGLYPDEWYKGNISFIDQIWHLDTTTGEVKLISNLTNESKDFIDATDLTLDPRENYLYFVNKQDLTLWSLRLNQ